MLFQARSHVVQAHQHLAETRNQIGLRTTAVGDALECPPMKGSVATGVDNVIAIAA
jgi:hypothetical protein